MKKFSQEAKILTHPAQISLAYSCPQGLVTDEAGEPMTDVELRDELMTLLVAGHETTATTIVTSRTG
jgi:cytochrome P450